MSDDEDDDWNFDDEEQEDGEASQAFQKPPQLLLGIDTHPSMFAKTEDGLHAFHSCLLGLYTILDHLLLKVDQKTIAVILAHNSESKSTLIDFDMLPNKKLLAVKKLLDLKDEALKEEFMRSGNFDFASFLLSAKKQFQKSSDTRTRTFLYITNDSDPTDSDAQLKFRVLNEARNFSDLKINFELVTMSPEFTWSTFYEEMYKAMGLPLIKELCEDDDGVVDKVLPIVQPTKYHRSTRFYPNVDKHKRFMKVLVTSFSDSSKLLFNKKFTRDRHLEVAAVKISSGIETEKIAVLQKDFEIKIKCEVEEKMRLSPYPVGYALLGMIDKPLTRPEMVFKKNDVMFENPKEIEKYNHFNDIWQYCAAKDKVMLCSFRATKKSVPGFCELIPKVYDKKRAFLIKYLYFREDVLQYPEIPTEDETESPGECDEETIDTVKKLVDALTFNYDPKAFNDYEIAKTEAYVKAQLLEQPMESVEDFLENTQQIDSVLNDLGLVQKEGKYDVKEEQAAQTSKKQRSGGRVKKEVKEEGGKKRK